MTVRADVLRQGAPVPSPCNSVCRIDPASGWCAGCWRTIDEIVAWGSLDDAGKRAVWSRLGQRRAQAPSSADEARRRAELRP